MCEFCNGYPLSNSNKYSQNFVGYISQEIGRDDTIRLHIEEFVKGTLQSCGTEVGISTRDSKIPSG